MTSDEFFVADELGGEYWFRVCGTVNRDGEPVWEWLTIDYRESFSDYELERAVAPSEVPEDIMRRADEHAEHVVWAAEDFRPPTDDCDPDHEYELWRARDE